MPLIDTTHLLRVADRAAAQYQFIADALEQARQEGSGYYFDIVTDTNDPDVEIPTERPYQLVDEDLLTGWCARNGTQLAQVIGAMEAHFNRRDAYGNPLQAGGWDGYCATQDVRVSWYFSQLFLAVKRCYMLAINVFSESDDVFGTVEIDSGPSIDFTDGVNYGDGSDTKPANGTYYAATQLKVVVQAFSSAKLDLRLSVKDVDNNPTTIDVTIPASASPGDEIDVGTASNRFLDVFAVSFVPFGGFGTLGDIVTIQNKKERQISL